MELRMVGENKTRLKLSKKRNLKLIEQLRFIGAVSVNESSRYVYFEFNGDIPTTQKMLGIY